MTRQRVRSRLGIMVVGLLGLVLVGAAAGARAQFFVPTKNVKGAATLRACIQRTGSEENIGDLNVRVKACGGRRPLVIPLGTSAGTQGPAGPQGATGPRAQRDPQALRDRPDRKAQRDLRDLRVLAEEGGQARRGQQGRRASRASRAGRIVRCRDRLRRHGLHPRRSKVHHRDLPPGQGRAGWRSLCSVNHRSDAVGFLPRVPISVVGRRRRSSRIPAREHLGACCQCSLRDRQLTKHDCGPPSRSDASSPWPGQAAGPRAAAAATPPGASGRQAPVPIAGASSHRRWSCRPGWA